MVYKEEYDGMSIVELLTVCEAGGISYQEGGEILDADEIRVKLGKGDKEDEPSQLELETLEGLAEDEETPED